MATILVLIDLPVGSADDIDDTELSLLIRQSAVADIIDYVDADAVDITPKVYQHTVE